jgi:hypothetical protein
MGIAFFATRQSTLGGFSSTGRRFYLEAVGVVGRSRVGSRPAELQLKSRRDLDLI